MNLRSAKLFGYLVWRKCSVTDLCGHSNSQQGGGGQWARDLVGESHDQRDKICWAANNAHFFHGISDHKDQFLSPVVRALHLSYSLLFEEIPVAHTGFPYTFLIAF